MSMENPAEQEWNEAITPGEDNWYSVYNSQNSWVKLLYRN